MKKAALSLLAAASLALSLAACGKTQPPLGQLVPSSGSAVLTSPDDLNAVAENA